MPQADRIRHASNGGDQRVLHFLVDGLDVQNHIVYEFHGCLWQGCPRCHPHQVRGFTLYVRGQQQLNYNIMRQNLLDELTDPLDERRNINVVNPNFFTRHSATKQLKVGPRTKRYGLVFDKRVVDPDTFKSYPYGYTPSGFNDVDMENAETLFEL